VSGTPWHNSDGQDPSDEALIAAYVAGGPQAGEAFDRLVDRHAQFVYAVCFRYFGNPADAEDAAQDAFVTVLRRASSYRGSARFSTWLYRVTINACNDIARRRSRRPRAGGVDVTILADLAAADDPLATRELSVELERALARLDPTTRTLVLLHDVQGLPYADIAARLGLPVGTVKSRIHRGHARLASLLQHLSATTGDTGRPDPREPLPPAGPPRR
jgi:RNA polymerase sigma-70 factor, ECF subfamily